MCQTGAKQNARKFGNRIFRTLSSMYKRCRDLETENSSRMCGKPVKRSEAFPGKHRVTEYKCASRYIKEKLGAFLIFSPRYTPFSSKLYLEALFSCFTFALLLK